MDHAVVHGITETFLQPLWNRGEVLTTLDYFQCLRAHSLSLTLSLMASSPWRSTADSAVALHDSQSSIVRSVQVYRETAADFFGFLRILLDMQMVVATASTRRSRKTTCLQMQVLSYLALLAKTVPRMSSQSKRRYKLLPLSWWTSSFTKPEHRMHVYPCNGKQRGSIKSMVPMSTDAHKQNRRRPIHELCTQMFFFLPVRFATLSRSSTKAPILGRPANCCDGKRWHKEECKQNHGQCADLSFWKATTIEENSLRSTCGWRVAKWQSFLPILLPARYSSTCDQTNIALYVASRIDTATSSLPRSLAA
jgi:hypothetical protein